MLQTNWEGRKLEKTYQIQFQVRSYEIDSKGKIKISAMLNYLQEAASQHAARLGASVVDLFPRNLTWVLSRYHIQIVTYPSWGETITINTWPSAKENLFALREFEILDQKGKRCAIATSSWMLLDFKKKQPVRPKDHLPHFQDHPERIIDDKFDPLPAPEKIDIELPFRVRMSDLDLNRHANHVSYIEWALETVPVDILKKYQPAELEISFRGEALYGDRISSRTQIVNADSSAGFLHQISRETDGKELTRLKSSWQVFS